MGHLLLSLLVVAAIPVATLCGPISVSCTGGTPIYTNDGYSGSCTGYVYGTTPPGQAGGNISLSFSFTHDLLSGLYTLADEASTYAISGVPSPLYNSFAEVRGTINYSQVFNSGGLPRQGLLYISNGGGTLAGYDGNQTLTMGFPNGSLVGVPATVQTQSNCIRYQGCGYGSGYYSPTAGIITYPIPVLLGTNMTLLAESNVYDYAGPYEGFSTGYGSATFQFLITETDGTPATLIPTPEPSSFSLMGMTVVGVGYWLLRRTRRN